MTLQQVEREIEQLDRILQADLLELRNAQDDVEGWQRAYNTDMNSGASAATIANTQYQLQRAQQRLKNAKTKLEGTQERMQVLQDRLKLIEESAAQAIASGMNPAQAYELAAQKVGSEVQLKKFLMWSAAIIGLIVIAWLIIRWKRKK